MRVEHVRVATYRAGSVALKSFCCRAYRFFLSHGKEQHGVCGGASRGRCAEVKAFEHKVAALEIEALLGLVEMCGGMIYVERGIVLIHHIHKRMYAMMETE